MRGFLVFCVIAVVANAAPQGYNYPQPVGGLISFAPKFGQPGVVAVGSSPTFATPVGVGSTVVTPTASSQFVSVSPTVTAGFPSVSVDPTASASFPGVSVVPGNKHTGGLFSFAPNFAQSGVSVGGAPATFASPTFATPTGVTSTVSGQYVSVNPTASVGVFPVSSTPATNVLGLSAGLVPTFSGPSVSVGPTVGVPSLSVAPSASSSGPNFVVGPTVSIGSPGSIVASNFGASSSATVITKHFYLHSAPEETEEDVLHQQISTGPAHKHYKIVFIKAPYESHRAAALTIAQAQNEEKTVIYVLSKKTDAAELKTAISAAPQTATKPEVYFIKYRTPDEALHAQQQIQAQYDALGGSTNVSDEGLAPVTSVIGSLGQGGHTVGGASTVTVSDRSGLVQNAGGGFSGVSSTGTVVSGLAPAGSELNGVTVHPGLSSTVAPVSQYLPASA